MVLIFLLTYLISIFYDNVFHFTLSELQYHDQYKSTWQPEKSERMKNQLNLNQIIPDNDTESNINYAIELIRWQLQILGIWPLSSNSSKFNSFFSIVQIILVWLLLVFLFLPGLYLIKLVDGIGVKFRLGGPISFCTMAMMKYFYLLTELDKLKKCFLHLITDWYNVTCPHDQDIMIRRSQQGHFGASICALFMLSGALFYSLILPNISGGDKSISNVTARPVAYPGHFEFFDPQESPAYEIVFFIQCCCSLTMHSIASTVCGIAIVLIMHACGQLEVICLSMKKLKNNTSEISDVERSFAQILQHHIRTLSFINNVDKLLCNICLVDVVGCSLNLCVVGSGLILQWGHFDAIGIITYFLLVTSFVLNIFVFCYVGELLTEQCEEVGKKLYMIEWYHLPRKTSLNFILTIFMSQRPVILTAGKFFDLSLNSFCAIIRAAVAYLNFTRKYFD